MEAVLSLVGIVIGTGLLIYIIYRGFSVFVVAPVATAVAALLSKTEIGKLLLGTFAAGLAGFVQRFLLMFILSALFGKFMADSGAANSIALAIARSLKRVKSQKELVTVLAASLLTAILTYAGINVFVVIFTLVHIMKTLFKEMNVPWRLYGITTFGSVTFTMTMLPGTPSITNIVPIKYLGTTAYASPVIGILSSLLMIALAIVYTGYEVNKLRRNSPDEGFLPSGEGIDKTLPDLPETAIRHPLWRCFLPPVVLLVMMNFLKLTPEAAVLGGIVACWLVFCNQFGLSSLKAALNDGSGQALVPILSTALIVGFGAAVAKLPGFGLVVQSLMKIPGPPLFSLVAAANVAAGVTASSSGGLAVVLETLGKHYLAQGVSPDHLHRIAAIACGGLDSLPHTGGIIVFLAITRLTHQNTYKYMFVLTVIFPIIVALFAASLATLGLH